MAKSRAEAKQPENTEPGRAAILRRPYARVLTPDTEVGGYTAMMLEFPGCYAEGDTADEALAALERAADGWIAAALEMGQQIPAPTAERKYKGKIPLRLSPSLHEKAALAAEREGVSLNRFIGDVIAEAVGARSTQTLAPTQTTIPANPYEEVIREALESFGKVMTVRPSLRIWGYPSHPHLGAYDTGMKFITGEPSFLMGSYGSGLNVKIDRGEFPHWGSIEDDERQDDDLEKVG